MIVARTHPARHEGTHYQLPYRGEDASGLGKPLKLITRPRFELPIYLASIGPKNVQLTAEIADGWLPVFFSPDRSGDIWQPLLDAGFAASGEPDKAERFAVVPALTAIVTDDLDAARNTIRPHLAFYIGGMGAKGKNFYNDLACRYGYEAEAARIQELYLDGKRKEATMAVPDALVDELNLLGTPEMIRDRLDAWRDAGVTDLSLTSPDRTTLRTMAELVL